MLDCYNSKVKQGMNYFGHLIDSEYDDVSKPIDKRFP